MKNNSKILISKAEFWKMIRCLRFFYFRNKSVVVIWKLMWHNKWENVKNKKNPD